MTNFNKVVVPILGFVCNIIFTEGRLSITGRTGGQIQDRIKAELDNEPKLGAGWTAELVRKFLDIWDRWHLNDMKAGCEHQRALGWGHGKTIAITKDDATPRQLEVLRERNFKRVEQEREEERLKIYRRLWENPRDRHHEIKQALGQDSLTIWQDEAARTLLGDILAGKIKGFRGQKYDELKKAIIAHVTALAQVAIPCPPFEAEIFKDCLSAPCPECGYFYGSAWLKEEVPQEILDWLKALPDASELEKESSLDKFIRELGITAEVKQVENNPHMLADPEWNRTASHYKVTLFCQGRQLTVPFSMGSAHRNPPTIAEVLSCLADDAASIENAQSFEDWSNELGYDSDSRKAKKLYDTCERQARKLQGFLGDSYETLLWKIRRD